MPLPRWLRACVLVVVGVAAYSNTAHVPFLFDDVVSIVNNRTLRPFSPRVLTPPAETTVAGRPVANASFALNAAISGLRLPPLHWTNLALHLLAGLLLMALVRRTLQLPRFGGAYVKSAEPLALFAALLWVVHPVQTESVTYLVQRVESLAGLFLLLTLHAALRAHEAARPLAWSAAAILFCGLGMGSKETMAVAPIIAALYDRAFLYPSMREALRKRWPLWAGLAATWLVLGLQLSTGPRKLSAGFHFPDFGPQHYLGIQLGAVVSYLRTLVLPVGLVFDYGEPGLAVPVPHSIGEWGPPAALLLLLLATSVWLWLRNPPAGFLALAFFVLLAPSSSVIPIVTEAMSEHRLYLPSAAALVLVVAGAWHLVQQRRALAALGIVVAIALAILTFQRNTVYGSAVSLWRDAAAKRPQNPRAWTELALAEHAAGNSARADAAYREAIRVAHDGYEEELRHNPRYLPALQGLGVQEEQRFDLTRDVTALDRAIELERRYLDRRPDDGDVRLNLAHSLEKRGRIDEALEQYRSAMDLMPRDAAIAGDAANCLSRAGHLDEAQALYRRALALRPAWALGHYNLAVSLARAGRADLALEEFHAALALDEKLVPAWHRAGLVAAWAGRPEEAVKDLETAIRLQADRSTMEDLAWIFATHPDARVRDGKRALVWATRANLNTETARSLDTLAAAQAENGEFELAGKSIARALDLAPAGPMREAFLARQRSYRKREPWRETPSPGK